MTLDGGGIMTGIFPLSKSVTCLAVIQRRESPSLLSEQKRASNSSSLRNFSPPSMPLTFKNALKVTPRFPSQIFTERRKDKETVLYNANFCFVGKRFCT